MSYMFCNCDTLLYIKDLQKNYSDNINLDFSRMNSEYNKLSEKDSKKNFFLKMKKILFLIMIGFLKIIQYYPQYH